MNKKVKEMKAVTAKEEIGRCICKVCWVIHGHLCHVFLPCHVFLSCFCRWETGVWRAENHSGVQKEIISSHLTLPALITSLRQSPCRLWAVSSRSCSSEAAWLVPSVGKLASAGGMISSDLSWRILTGDTLAWLTGITYPGKLWMSHPLKGCY